MLGTLATLFGLRRSLGTGIAIAALLVALGPYLPKNNSHQQQAVHQQELASRVEQTVPAEASPTAIEENSSATQHTSTLEDSLQVLNLDENGFNWRQDWWKYTLMACAVLFLAYFALKITNLLFRTAIVILCVAFGLLGSLLATPFVTPILEELLAGKLPSFLAPAYISYALCFLVCYLAITFLTNSVRKSAPKTKDSND